MLNYIIQDKVNTFKLYNTSLTKILSQLQIEMMNAIYIFFFVKNKNNLGY